MNTDLIWQTVSISSANTVQIGEQIGKRLKGGETIELISDVGGGKTTFVHGLAAGFGSPDVVASPSFTISRQYRADDQTLYHFDFYRLTDPGIVANELAEATADVKAVSIIEWAAIVEGILPSDRLVIRISVVDDERRRLEFSGPETVHYLIEGLS